MKKNLIIGALILVLATVAATTWSAKFWQTPTVTIKTTTVTVVHQTRWRFASRQDLGMDEVNKDARAILFLRCTQPTTEQFRLKRKDDILRFYCAMKDGRNYMELFNGEYVFGSASNRAWWNLPSTYEQDLAQARRNYEMAEKAAKEILGDWIVK